MVDADVITRPIKSNNAMMLYMFYGYVLIHHSSCTVEGEDLITYLVVPTKFGASYSVCEQCM